MEIREMNLEQIEERRAELAEEIKTADMERLNAINAELDEIEARKAEIRTEAEERAKTIAEVLEAPAEPTPIINKEERTNKMTDREIRSTQEYIDAYAELVKKGYDLEKVGTEKRALLSENAPHGTIAVPTFVEDRINAAWENNEIMRRIRKTYLPGVVKVGVEVSASPAAIHPEGSGAVLPENLTIKFVSLIPEFAKKLVEVSHTALEMGPREFLDYLFDEIEYQIIRIIANNAVLNVAGSDFTHAYTISGQAPTTAEIIEAQGFLTGDANPVIVTTRQVAATLKAAALSAQYGYDPFDGLEVLYCDAAALGDAKAIIVDLGAVQANFPDGAEPKFVFDEYTKADENIVRIIGRLNVAVDLVAVGKAVALKTDGGGE